MKADARGLRLALGAIVLLILAAIGWLLIPSYTANWQLQRYITELSETAPRAAPAESARAAVVNKAASLGLPVRSDDVHVAISPAAVRIEVLYVVHVDVAGYSVDLHFRPAAGGN